MPAAMEGHRERMRQRAASMGTEGIRSQDLLEILLYYALPRRDTRDMAFVLMEVFGSLENVLSASEDELVCRGNIGRRTAKWIRALGELVDTYRELSIIDRPRIFSLERVTHMLNGFFKNADYPSVWQFMFTSGGRLMGHGALAPCGAWAEPGYLRDALNMAMDFKCRSVIIAQYSATPCDEPDEYDITGTHNYSRVLDAAGIKLIDHVIVHPSGLFSMFHKNILGWQEDDTKLNADVMRYSLAEGDFNGDLYT